jgi:micrococcal nuclease
MIRKQLAIATILLLTLCAEGVNAGQWVTVKRVADGDTVQLADGRSVRYIGVNTPEIQHERHTAESFGLEDRSFRLTSSYRVFCLLH